MTTRKGIETWTALALGGAALVMATFAACTPRAEAQRTGVGAMPAARIEAGPAVTRVAAPGPAFVANPDTASAPQPPVLATQEFTTDPDLRCDVLEVKRVSGGALLVKWRLSRPPAGGTVATSPAKPIYHNWGWEGVYFTDAAENKKYLGLRDSSGAWLAQGRDQSFGPGDRQVLWMKFPAPPESSTRITFVFPGFGPFEDLPVGR
jgi:hypothetical protein